MGHDLAFQTVQILYWLALSTWFGAVLFIAVAAPVIFRTVRESNPVLPDVLSVNLEGEHGTLLAGTIVGNLLNRLGAVQAVCAAVVLLMTIAHWFLADLSGGEDLIRSNRTAAIVRTLLAVAAAGAAMYDWRVIGPRIEQHRKQYLDHADEPELAKPAHDAFDWAHRRSVTLLMTVVALLLGLIVFSANISPRVDATVSISSAIGGL